MAQHSVGAILPMAGSLPSRAIGMMVFIANTSPPTTFKFVSKQNLMCRLFQSAFPAECAIVPLIRRYVMENYLLLQISHYVTYPKNQICYSCCKPLNLLSIMHVHICRYNKQRAFDHEGWAVGAVVGVLPTTLTKKVAYSNVHYLPPKLTDLKHASQAQNVRHFL